jgi:hypothetical protein
MHDMHVINIDNAITASLERMSRKLLEYETVPSRHAAWQFQQQSRK